MWRSLHSIVPHLDQQKHWRSQWHPACGLRRQENAKSCTANKLAVAPGQWHLAGFTLVEMLVAITITLVMMAAVVTLFANVSGGVRNRRATVEMSGQLRSVRNKMQQDLQGATCPGTTWQRPESNHGYIELIEGQYREGNASNLIDANPTSSPVRNWPPTELNPEIDHAASNIPSSNLPFNDPSWATDGGGLGDADDILMLTVRNEHEPFVGRMPSNLRLRNQVFRFNVSDSEQGWDSETIESPLAEVIWFAIENPGFTGAAGNDPTANGFFGEPGMRTIYRRTLLIAPWVNPYRMIINGVVSETFQEGGQTFKAEPGLVRMLPANISSMEQAIAAIIAFQDRYDLSVRLEWDHNIQRWKIVANTLADLTKRENRFGHYGFRMAGGSGANASRFFPYPIVSLGSDYSGGSEDIGFVTDPDIGGTNPAEATAHVEQQTGLVISYSVPSDNYTTPAGDNRMFEARPFVFVDAATNGVPATANAILNDAGQVVRVVHGPVPLWGTRRGEDVMMTGALAFDVRVYDPGAPLFRHVLTETVLEPSDQGWRGDPTTVGAYLHQDNMGSATGIGTAATTFQYVGQGAYVDLGYGYDPRWDPPQFRPPVYHQNFASAAPPWFFIPRALSDVFGKQLAPGYAVYDTWSFHYENNGVNEDADGVANGVWQPNLNAGTTPSIDEGTNGFEDYGHYSDGAATRLGVDDVGERETVPPYDKPLRGVQVLMRVYETDSRAIRQVRVNQHFMPE